MAIYRYLACDLVTNTLQAELPLQAVRYSAALNSAGGFDAAMPLNVQRQTSPGVWSTKAAELLAATQPGRTIVYVERNGQLVDAFIIWTRRYNSSNFMVQLGGKSTWSYFARRRNFENQSFTATGQQAIAGFMLARSAVPTGGNIGVTWAGVSGADTTTRSITYNGFERKKYSEIIEALAAMADGFDFAVDVAYAAGVPTKTFRTQYPRRGRVQQQSGHVFEVGRNIISYDFPEDSTTQSTQIIGFGAGDGKDMRTSPQSRPDLIDAGWPLLEDTVSFKDEQVQANLDARALAAVNARALPVTIPAVVVRADSDPQLGSWIVGDDALFVFGTDPLKPDPRFPTRAAFTWRIVGYEATPGDAGEEQVKLLLN